MISLKFFSIINRRRKTKMIQEKAEFEEKAVMTVAELMAMAARTAPKAKGTDNLEVLIVTGKEKALLAQEMKDIRKQSGVDFFERDGYCVDHSTAVVLIGTKISPVGCPNCGLCGYKDCAENKKNDGICSFNISDLGIAIGSAAAVAADHRCDNRVMFTAGKAAVKLEFFSEDVKVAHGIPLSVSGKSPFFDR